MNNQPSNSNKTVAIRRFMHLHFTTSNTDYRVLHITPEVVTIINMNKPNKVDISLCGIKNLHSMILSGTVEIIEEPEDHTVIDVDTLTESVKMKYLRNKYITDAVNAEYAPDYMGLTQKRGKQIIKEIVQRSGLTLAAVWAIIIKYLQSGCKDIGLLRKTRTDNLQDKTTSRKRGRKSNNPKRNGKNLTKDDRKIMDEFMHAYANNKLLTLKKSYDDMIIAHYTTETFNGESYTYEELPQSQRPTLDQFTYYVHKHMPKEERIKAKMGKREFRNEKRLLLGSSLNGVTGPASIVEMDACELDISVVSATDPTQAVGSPVVYFMIDLYSRLILAASLSFDNNSVLAMTNCLASLVEDKESLLESLGITVAPFNSGITLNDVMPANILPKVIRFDHGSDFISKQAQYIGQQLNIEIQYAPPSTGSLKGTVESSFHSFQSHFLDLTMKAGTKNHDAVSKPNREAKLTIENVKYLMYSFILQYNTIEHKRAYHLTPNMVKNNVGHVPAEVWRYGVKYVENPTYINDVNKFLFSLLIPASASLRRNGINYNKLRFIPDINNDIDIHNAMLTAGNGSIKFRVYIDLRTVRQIYYLDSNRTLRTAKLIDDINHQELAQMTWPEFNSFLREESRLHAEKDLEAGQTRRAHRRIEKIIVQNAKSRKGKTNDKNMKEARAAERSRVAGELAFDKRFGLGQDNTIPEPAEQIKLEPVEEHADLQNMTEAELEEFRKKQIASLVDYDEDDDY